MQTDTLCASVHMLELPSGAPAASSLKEQCARNVAHGSVWLRRHQGTFIHREHSQGRLLQTYTLTPGFSYVLLLHCSSLHEFLALFPQKLSLKRALNVSIDSLLLHQLPYHHIWIAG